MTDHSCNLHAVCQCHRHVYQVSAGYTRDRLAPQMTFGALDTNLVMEYATALLSLVPFVLVERIGGNEDDYSIGS